MYHVALTAVNGFITDLKCNAQLVDVPDKNIRESVAQKSA